jgi:RNA polymerase sigma-70 factor (ECF subfamily)
LDIWSSVDFDTMSKALQWNVQIGPSCELEKEQSDAVDPLLLEFLTSRSDASFAALARQALPRMLRYFSALGCRKSDAEDLAQNVLCILYRKIETIRDPRSYWGWMYKVARNELLCHVRRSSREVPSVGIDEVGEAKLPSISPGGNENRSGHSFADWMEWLETGEREVMVLRYVEDRDYSEIAHILRIPIGTVKSRLFKAKSKLSKHLPGGPNSNLVRGNHEA